MSEDFKFTISQKLLVKNIIDFLVLSVEFIVVGFLLFSNFTPFKNLTILFILIVIYFFQYNLTRHWVSSSIKKDISKQTKSISTIKNAIMELIQKHKLTLNDYFETTKSCTAKFETLKESSVRTKQISQIISEQVGNNLEYVKKEKDIMGSNSEKMFALKQRVQVIADLILELSEYNQQIGNNVGLVEDIAEQTNMLALNAAVEAARAGEHGKGFAVVASEIRKLADESKQATVKISSLINDIQNVTNSTVLATEEGSKEIESVVQNADLVNNNLENIVSIARAISENVYRINLDTQTMFSAEFNNTIFEFSDEINAFLKSLQLSVEQLNEVQSSRMNHDNFDE